jgi:hypothetical protein
MNAHDPGIDAESGEGATAEKESHRKKLLRRIQETGHQVLNGDDVAWGKLLSMGGTAITRTPNAILLNGEVAFEADPEQAKTQQSPPGRVAVKVKTLAEALADIDPPDILVERLRIAKGYTYSLTAITGTGKTAFLVRLALSIAFGLPVGGVPVTPTRVLYLAGENPDDTLPRFTVAAHAMGIDLAEVGDRIIITTATFDIGATGDIIAEQVSAYGDVGLVIVDTGPSFFAASNFADGENSNMDMINFAHALRSAAKTLGKKTTLIAAMHPAKAAASKEDLVPRGGGAFVNEVDGNLTLWSKDGGATAELHWTRKFRGAQFEPLMLRNVKTSNGGMPDASGKPMVSVYAAEMTEGEVIQQEKVDRSNAEKILAVLLKAPKNGMGPTEIAKEAKLFNKNGEPLKSTVGTILKTFEAEKMVTKINGNYALTAKGKKQAGATAGLNGVPPISWVDDLDE